MNKGQIIELLRSNDKAVARALVVLHDRQTNTEQNCKTTINRNGEGFRPCHARMGSSMAQFYGRNGYLSSKQVSYWRQPQRDGKMRIEIYASQLLEVAMSRAVAQSI